MKKLVLVLIIALTTAGIVSAQSWCGNFAYAQPLTIDGTLQLQNGVIALSNGNTVYYVPVLSRYVGFIEGLKEGAKVSIEGYAAGLNNVVHPVKITVNGKTYDVSSNVPGGTDYDAGYCGGYGGGHHGGYGMSYSRGHRGRW